MRRVSRRAVCEHRRCSQHPAEQVPGKPSGCVLWKRPEAISPGDHRVRRSRYHWELVQSLHCHLHRTEKISGSGFVCTHTIRPRARRIRPWPRLLRPPPRSPASGSLDPAAPAMPCRRPRPAPPLSATAQAPASATGPGPAAVSDMYASNGQLQLHRD